MIDTVISDLGQVLLHFNNALFFERMTKYTPRSMAEIRAATHDNRKLLDLFDTGKLTPKEFYMRAVEALDARVSEADFYAAYNDVFSVNTAVLAVIRNLRPKYRLVMLSNTDPVRYGHIERAFPELRIFDAYILSFRIGAMKPDPRVYREALRLLDALPENTLFIDDLQENLEGAARLGIKGILFTARTDLAMELEKFGVKA
jgi:epoxide hydrolase-like predicted phosphatase